MANDSNFTNNQNTRDCEYLPKELMDTTSLADMLRMARVCEGTVHSKEISKQYLESVKTVKQVDAIHRKNNRPKSGAVEAIETIADLNPGNPVRIAVLTIHPESAKLMARNAFTATRKGISVNYVIPNNVENLQG